MKDAKGHGSNAKGVAQAAGYNVVNRKDGMGHALVDPMRASGKFSEADITRYLKWIPNNKRGIEPV